MRNNKQGFLTKIRMTSSILGYDDDKLKELYGKTYAQISKLNADEIKKISNDLYNIYLRKDKKTEGYINYTNFTWNDNMVSDKAIWLKTIKEKILNGNQQYRDLYITDTYAFLAPDNYGANTVDNIDVDINTQLQQASKEFDKICNDIRNQFVWACQETDQLDLIDKTIGWKVRDFVSEGWYQSEQYDSTNNHRPFAVWRRVANKGTQILTNDMLCVEEHMSKYDKLN